MSASASSMSSSDAKTGSDASCVYHAQEFQGAAADLFTDSKYHRLFQHRLLLQQQPHTIDTTSSSAQSALQVLQKWFFENGGLMHRNVEIFEQDDTGNNREVRVIQEGVGEGECLLKIPRGLLICLSDAQAAPLALTLASRLEAALKFLDDHDTWLALFLLTERAKGKDSFYQPYLATLPRSFPTNPLFFGPEELQHLRGSMCVRHLKRTHDELQFEYAQLEQLLPEFTSVFSYGDFVWARLCVLSRQFSLDWSTHGREAEATMVPLLEMINHDANKRNVCWGVDHETGGAKLRADRQISPHATGEEGKQEQQADDAFLYVSYGHKSNARLLLHYGFVMRNNDTDEAEILLVYDSRVEEGKGSSTWAREALHKAKQRCISDGDMHPLKLGINTSETQRVLSFLRFNYADAEETPALIQTFGVTGAYIKCLSLQTELRVLQRLRTLCMEALSAFPTTMEEDLARIAKDKQTTEGNGCTATGGNDKGDVDGYTNMQNCFTLCLGEKETLWFWVWLSDAVTKQVRRHAFADGKSVFLDVIQEFQTLSFFTRHQSRLKFVKMYLWELVDAQIEGLNALKHGPLAL